jgi:hypothetical protein
MMNDITPSSKFDAFCDWFLAGSCAGIGLAIAFNFITLL